MVDNNEGKTDTPTKVVGSSEFLIDIAFMFDGGETPYEIISVWTLPDLTQFDIIIGMNIISLFDFAVMPDGDELDVFLSPRL
jgi:hypothetical protein